ncbi:hypothetical protein [Halomonas sp. 707D7]|uniref:hypothetical protein n=1 Tax=Halomonas sp. 707D7 TaxID=1681044 RepID=UPI0020A0F4D1|nr:hypothetical protein [Halomonas sp. 707D7]MCP1313351.1 hypothetical protein [Halomonas sp. 707D7]
MNDQDKHSRDTHGERHEHERLDTHRLKEQGQAAARDVYDAAEHQAEHLYDSQRQRFSRQAATFTEVMHTTAEAFDRHHQPFFSEQARKAAHYADSVSHQLRDKDLKHLCRDAERYSRREPAIFIGGAIAAGFLVARFLRSSASHDHGHASEYATDLNAAGSRYASRHERGESPRARSASGPEHAGYPSPDGVQPAYGGALERSSTSPRTGNDSLTPDDPDRPIR